MSLTAHTAVQWQCLPRQSHSRHSHSRRRPLPALPKPVAHACTGMTSRRQRLRIAAFAQHVGHIALVQAQSSQSAAGIAGWRLGAGSSALIRGRGVRA